MPRNKVQIQKAMSLAGFLARFGTEAQCEQALRAWRWPHGFVCPECGYAGHCVLGRGLFLLCIDEDLAAGVRAAGCHCGGVLHSARYPRKPRGCPAQVRAAYS